MSDMSAIAFAAPFTEIFVTECPHQEQPEANTSRYLDVVVEEGHPYLTPGAWRYAFCTKGSELEYSPFSFAGVLIQESNDEVITSIEHVSLVEGPFGHTDVFIIFLLSICKGETHTQYVEVEHKLY